METSGPSIVSALGFSFSRRNVRTLYIYIYIQTLCLPHPQRAGMMQVERPRDFHHDVVELPLHLLDASQVTTPAFSVSSSTIYFI